jgi:hypothetical protein
LLAGLPRREISEIRGQFVVWVFVFSKKAPFLFFCGSTELAEVPHLSASNLNPAAQPSRNDAVER